MSSEQKYREQARDIPVAGEFDVLVCGGGTAGAPAAITAARLGAKTAVIERHGFLGGVPAYSIMPAWHRMQYLTKGPLIEFAKKIPSIGNYPDPLDHKHIEPEAFKALVMEQAEEAGAEIMLHSIVCQTISRDNSLQGVIVENKSGRQAVFAKVILDCTGDADVVHLAGGRCLKGDDDGIMQGISLRFRVGYINFDRYFEWISRNRHLYKISDQDFERISDRAKKGLDFFLQGNLDPLYDQHDKEKKCPRGSYFNCSSVRPGELSINATRINYLDGTSSKDLSKAEITCRKQAHDIYRFLSKNIPGFEDSRLVETAAQVGVRESRRIAGMETVTEKHCRDGAKFHDSVLSSKVTFDMHDPRKYSCENTGTNVDIPYRALIPESIDNIIVAGRCISSDHVANSTLRMMLNAFSLGCVAGAAAALSVKHNNTPRELPYPVLKEALEQLGTI